MSHFIVQVYVMVRDTQKDTIKDTKATSFKYHCHSYEHACDMKCTFESGSTTYLAIEATIYYALYTPRGIVYINPHSLVEIASELGYALEEIQKQEKKQRVKFKPATYKDAVVDEDEPSS